jgi:hypothetical protein
MSYCPCLISNEYGFLTCTSCVHTQIIHEFNKINLINTNFPSNYRITEDPEKIVNLIVASRCEIDFTLLLHIAYYSPYALERILSIRYVSQLMLNAVFLKVIEARLPISVSILAPTVFPNIKYEIYHSIMDQLFYECDTSPIIFIILPYYNVKVVTNNVGNRAFDHCEIGLALLYLYI